MTSFREIFKDHEGPPVNVEGIIRTMGIQLDRKADLDPEIAGQIERLPDGTYKISVNKSDHYYRRRFTMAHELGHYLYHRHRIGDGVDDDRAYRSTPNGKFYNRSITSVEETESNRFAASLLMPKHLVQAHFDGVDLEGVAKKFQVSSAAMRIRLKGLGLLQPTA